MRNEFTAVIERDGKSLAVVEPEYGAIQAVPRHAEIADPLARKICRNLSVPEISR